jgi:tetratricopeptide (TPR) repeat protein
MTPSPAASAGASHLQSRRKGVLTGCILRHSRIFSAVFLASLLMVFTIFAHGALDTHTTPAASAETELRYLIGKATAARTSCDPAQVIAANRQLTAFALRMMGKLRLLESAYPQAIALYRQSLAFQDMADTRVDLSIAQLGGGHITDAIHEASAVLAADPADLRAAEVLGRAYLRHGDFAHSADLLRKAVAAHPQDLELQFLLATALMHLQTPAAKQEAQSVFEKIAALHGNTAALHVRFGQIDREAGDMPAAEEQFRKAIALDPSSPDVHYFLGLAELASNDWKPTDAAVRQFHEELKYHPNDFAANYILGVMASTERQYAVANKYLQKSVQANPAWPDSWLYLGLNAYAQGDLKTAEAMLRKAIAATGKDESRSNYQIRRAYIDMGRILSQTGRQQEAEVYLAKARELQNKVMQADQQSLAAVAATSGAGSIAAAVPLAEKPSTGDAPPDAAVDPAIPLLPEQLKQSSLTPAQQAEAAAQETHLRAVLGQSLSDMGTAEAIQKNFSAALDDFQQAAEWDANTPRLAANLGQVAFQMKNYTVAAQWLARAMADDPAAPPALHAMLGMSYYAGEQFKLAAQAFSPLGTRGMQDPAVGYMWADALTRLQDLKQATTVLAAYEAANSSDEQLLLAGRLWIQIGDYTRAVDAFQRALQHDPSLRQAHYFEGEAYMHAERWPDAAQQFQQELDRFPQDVNAMYDLGYADLRMSKLADAEALFRRTLALQPEYANAAYQLGKMLLEQGKVQASIPYLGTAARLLPDQDYVHYQLQKAYRKAGRTADANRELKVYSAIKARSHVTSGMSGGTAH